MNSAMRAHAGRHDDEDDDEPAGFKEASVKSVTFGHEPAAASPADKPPSPSRTVAASLGPPSPTNGLRQSEFEAMGLGRKSLLRGSEYDASVKLAGSVSLTFRQCDADQNGLLSRSEFTAAVQMVCTAAGQRQWYDELDDEELDTQFEAGLSGVAGHKRSKEEEDAFSEGQLNETMFDSWVATFRDGYLHDRRRLRNLGIGPKDQCVAVPAGTSSSTEKAVLVVARRCAQLRSLELRGEVSATALDLLATHAGHRLHRLDVSFSTVDNRGLQALCGGLGHGGAQWKARCPALLVVRLVGCNSVGAEGVQALLALAKTAMLSRVIIGEAADPEALAHLGQFPSHCEVIRVPVGAENTSAVDDDDLLFPCSKAAAPESAPATSTSQAEIEVEVLEDEKGAGSGSCCILL